MTSTKITKLSSEVLTTETATAEKVLNTTKKALLPLAKELGIPGKTLAPEMRNLIIVAMATRSLEAKLTTEAIEPSGEVPTEQVEPATILEVTEQSLEELFQAADAIMGSDLYRDGPTEAEWQDFECETTPVESLSLAWVDCPDAEDDSLQTPVVASFHSTVEYAPEVVMALTEPEITWAEVAAEELAAVSYRCVWSLVAMVLALCWFETQLLRVMTKTIQVGRWAGRSRGGRWLKSQARKQVRNLSSTARVIALPHSLPIGSFSYG